VFVYVYPIFCIITIGVTVGLVMKLCRKGTSRELRNLICKRHCFYIVVYLLTMFQKAFTSSFVHYWNSEDVIAKRHTTLIICRVTMFLNLLGLALFLIRFKEPYVLLNIKRDLGCGKAKKKKTRRAKFTEESLSVFLQSATNVEYVFLILSGINIFFEQVKEKD
jgi:hypothetical protein